MMEVKHNTKMDFTEIVGNNKSNGSSSLDDNDTVMTDLTLNNIESDLLKESSDVEAVATSLIGIDSPDLQTSVNSSELEDVLLADDDLVTAANIDAENLTNLATVQEDVDKIDALSSILDAENERNVGDDLDTLLSKINDIVDDCMEGAGNSDIREKIDPNELLSDIEKNMSSIESDATDLLADLLETVAQRNGEEKNVDYILIGEEDDQIVTKEPVDPVKELPAIEVCEKLNELNENCEELLDEKEKESQSLESSTISDIKCNSGEILTLENVEIEKTLNETDHAKLEKNIKKLEEYKTVENEVKQDENLKGCQATEQEMITEEKLHESEGRNEIVEEKTKDQAKEIKIENIELSVNKNDLEVERNEDDINNKEELDNKENDKQKIEVKVDEEETKLTPVIVEEEAFVVQLENIEAAKKLNNKDEIKHVEVAMKQKEEEINKSPIASANASDVSDVILVLDDENDEGDVSQQKKNENEIEKVQKQPETESDKVKESTKEGTTKENKCEDTGDKLESTKAGPFLQPDNSDNACDDFTTKKPSEEKEAEKTAEEAEETNSNCSSGSNLLQEAKNIEHISEQTSPAEADNEDDEEENDNENENENDLDDNDGDLEIIENETKETEENETMPPPLKRQRLSVDNEETQVSMTKVDVTEATGESELSSTAVVAQTEEDRSQKISDEKAENKNENETTENATTSLKRSHEVIELEGDEEDDQAAKTVEANKKVKTDDELKTSTTVENKKEIAELVGVPSHIQIPLYPPPKLLNTSATTSKDYKLSLDFLKRFRKTFDKMTKQDLEEMVLQKVVEAIIHKSEFSEMREVIDKQEKIITAHRNKLSELTKQFRDLEMVHSRVLKDIESRNSQFIMPVKITRAVGLQVYIPSKKNITEAINSSTQISPHRSGGILAQQLISPQRPMTSTNISDNFTTLSTRISNSAASSSLSAAGGNTRRGCVQKITPIRPMPTLNSLPSNTTPGYRSLPTPSGSGVGTITAAGTALPNQPRILNKNATNNNIPSAAISGGSSVQRYSLPVRQASQSMTSASASQLQRQTNVSTSGQRTANSVAASILPKSSQSSALLARRSSEPLGTNATAPAAASLSVDNYLTSINQLSGSNTSVSITSAKPKDKAFIDLTDEDEAPPPAPSMTISGGGGVNQRRISPAAANVNTQYNRSTPPLARVNAMTVARARTPLQSPLNSLNKNLPPSFPGMGNANAIGGGITRVNVASNSAAIPRLKYNHPAPLPPTPPQVFNPAWKLPPPRPTIRISNLDNGIVISWTMEESLDHYDECVTYQIYAYQEPVGPPSADSWRHVGDVKAMLLPMAVTLTQFQEGQRYYFAVRAMDCHQRYGPFSLPKTWS